MKKRKKLLNIFNCYEVAPFLHLQIQRLKNEMEEIFEYKVVEELFLFFIYIFGKNPAWDILELPDKEPDPLLIPRAVKYLRDLESRHVIHHKNKIYSIYSSLTQAVRAISHRDNYQDLFDDLPIILRDERAEKFLAVIAQILEMLLYHEAEANGPGEQEASEPEEDDPLQKFEA